MIRARVPALILLGGLAAIGACDSGEIVVFSAAEAGFAGASPSAGLGGAGGAASVGSAGSSLPTGGAGTSSAGGSGGDSCQSSDDCDQAWFCQKQACTDATGVCNPVPLSDDPVRKVVCGCGSITYWNDTLRQQSRNSASTSGACATDVMPCSSDHDCVADPDARCSRRLRDLSSCSTPGTGQCWVVPSDCSVSDDAADLLPCPPPGPPSSMGPPCFTLCQAISSGIPFFKKRTDYTCP